MNQRFKFRVAICGGGIGGLTLAVALSRFPNIQVDVYEAAEQFKEIGAGVMIWARTWEILTLLGMAADFSRIAHAPPDGSPSRSTSGAHSRSHPHITSLGVAFDYRKSDQPREGFRFYLFQVPYGCIRFHRAQFLDVLVDHLPKEVAHFGKRLTSYHSSDGLGPAHSELELHFADGTHTMCDLLVGCDGIKSVVRKQMFEDHVWGHGGERHLLDHIEPVWSGSIAYRGLIPVEHLIGSKGEEHSTIRSPMMYCGKRKHIVSYSISNGSVVNVVAMASKPHLHGTTYFGPWVTECKPNDVLQCFNGWEPEVVELLKCIERPTKWALHELKPLPFYTQGRVALLGDAAHAMTPHQGAGAGQAIEDAFILAELLGHACTNKSTLAYALSAYEHVRLPAANHILKGSRMSGDMYEFNGSLGDDLPRLGAQIGHQWDWLWGATPQQESERAIQRLAQMVTPTVRL